MATGQIKTNKTTYIVDGDTFEPIDEGARAGIASLKEDLSESVDYLNSALLNTESEVNAIGQFVGCGIIPVVKTGMYYTGSVGSAYSTSDNDNSVYIEPVDVSSIIGKKLTISLDGTNDGSRCFGFCDEDGIIDTVYTEASSRSMFSKHGDRYEADFDITGKFFFFSYAIFTSPTPKFIIPNETLVYTKNEIDALNLQTNNNISGLSNFVKTGFVNIAQPDYEQIGSEKRIWFSGSPDSFVPAIQAGDSVSVLDTNYDVGIKVGSGVPNWTKGFIVPTDGFIGYGIRKTDLSDISALTQAEIKSIIKVERISDTLKVVVGKKAHFSFDDCLFWTDLIDNATVYTSAFENSFLSDLRDIHAETDAVFTLNCFCSTTGYDISDVPTKFAVEFNRNSDWLKFSFHAENSSATYSADKVAEISASYNKFITAIYAMTGSINCIDTVVRLGGFTGTINNVAAIRDLDCGITGLLTADDTRVSYYFDTATNNYMITHGEMLDADNHLLLVHSQLRLESVNDIQAFCSQYLTTSYGNYIKSLEFFTHEYKWNSTMKGKVTTLMRWLAANSYLMGYWM